MKDFLKHVGVCIVSGFASQIGVILAQELISKYYDKSKRTIGFTVR